MSLFFLSLTIAGCEYDGCLKQDVDIHMVESDEVDDLVCTTIALVSGEPPGTKLQVFYGSNLDGGYTNPVDLLMPEAEANISNLFVVIDGVMAGSSALAFNFIDGQCMYDASIAWMMDVNGNRSTEDEAIWGGCGHTQYVGEDYFTFPTDD